MRRSCTPCLGRGYHKLEPVQPEPKEYGFAQMFWEVSRELLASGKLKTVSPTVNLGCEGLGGVLKGLDELRADWVSGTKLVHTLKLMSCIESG